MDGQGRKYHKGYCRTEPACKLNHIYHKNDNLSNPFLCSFFASPSSHPCVYTSFTVNQSTRTYTRILQRKKNPCNYIATATYPNVCVHAYGCIRAFCVAVLGACSASPSAHGSCIIPSNHATAMGILWQCSLRAEVFEYLCRGCNPDLILSSSVLARANRR